jgi:hypothetical protein
MLLSLRFICKQLNVAAVLSTTGAAATAKEKERVLGSREV